MFFSPGYFHTATNLYVLGLYKSNWINKFHKLSNLLTPGHTSRLVTNQCRFCRQCIKVLIIIKKENVLLQKLKYLFDIHVAYTLDNIYTFWRNVCTIQKRSNRQFQLRRNHVLSLGQKISWPKFSCIFTSKVICHNILFKHVHIISCLRPMS